MKKAQIETGKMPFITIPHCGGDLIIRGWAEPAVSLNPPDINSEESDNGLIINSDSTVKLKVPTDASLNIEHVSGDLIIKNVTGDISLGEVMGDAVLNGVGLAKIQQIYGDLSARHLAGSLSIDIVYGDLAVRHALGIKGTSFHGDTAIRHCAGDVQLGEVMGDINLSGIEGDTAVAAGRRDANIRGMGGSVTLPEIMGDIRIVGPLPEGKHTFKAAGDIVLRWPENAPIVLEANAPKIKNRLNLEGIQEEEGSLAGQIGSAQTMVFLTADGRIILKTAQPKDEKWDPFQGDEFDFNFSFDLEGLGERINSQVADHVARFTSDFENRFGPDFTEKFAKQAERAAAKAERAAEQAMRRAEQNMRKWQRHGRFAPPRPFTPARPEKKAGASKEEQLKILRMVENGIISPEEANSLLKAMEG